MDTARRLRLGIQSAERMDESIAAIRLPASQPRPMEYLAGRKAWAAEQRLTLRDGLAELARLADILGQATRVNMSCSAGASIT